jgi:hypothetical protein|tara:strand:+ start:840 stop:1022 length:183 start_codon:yes stop_codon:yes gene_type:complete
MTKQELINATKTQEIARLEKQIQEWTAKLNRSRKNSLIAMRAMHRNMLVAKLNRLQRENA